MKNKNKSLSVTNEENENIIKKLPVLVPYNNWNFHSVMFTTNDAMLSGLPSLTRIFISTRLKAIILVLKY